MRAAWFVARTQLRARWGSMIVLTVIVGLTGAVVLASFAGARRTSTAYDRFRDETLEPNLTVFAPSIDDATVERLRAVRGVEGLAVLRQLTALVGGSFTGAVAGRFDREFGRTVGRARVLDGRLPRQDRINEVMVPEPLAKSLGIGVGDTVTFEGFTPGQVATVLEGGDVDLHDPKGPKARLHVVGVTRSPQDLSFQGAQGGVIVATRAFTDRYADQIGSFAGTVLVVRTADDDAARRFVRAARNEAADLGPQGEFQVQPTSETTGAVRESITVVSTGLVVFAIVAAIAGLVVVGVVTRRFVDSGASDLEALRGLGVSRRGRALVLALPVLPVAALGSVLAVLGAWLVSPIFPLGLARKAEPHPGLRGDALVLGLGVVAGVLLVAALGWISARLVVRAALRRSDPSIRPAALTSAVGTSSPTVQVGVSAATNRNRASAPALPAVAGVLVAVAGLLAVGMVATSIRHLERTPSTYGYNWDAHVIVHDANRVAHDANDVAPDANPCTPAQVAAARDRAVAAAADICSESIEIDGYAVTGTGFMPLRGDIGPTVLAGRAPRTAREIALGTTTFSRVHKSIGDTVRVVGSSAELKRYKIVGRVALPVFTTASGEGEDIQAIADGAAFTGTGLERVTAASPPEQARLVLRWRDGADVAAAKARIDGLPGRTHRPRDAEAPLEVDRLRQVHVLPWLLGAFLVLIGILGLGFGLVTSVRRRAREIAVLKTIGFRRAQVEGSVAVQATAYGLLGLVLGGPLGVVIGRATWSRIADHSGFAVRPVVSLVVAAIVVAGTLVVVNAVAWLPARRAARLRPAVVLRSE
jgi:ABC-type antimicrobial peptide transport system permease subunit